MIRLTLSERAHMLVRILMVLGFLNLAILVFLVVSGRPPGALFGWVAAVEVLLYGGLGAGIVKYLYRPFEDTAKLYQRFADGQAYEELFESGHILMPQWDKVLNKFRHLLSKQDAIRMSKKQAEYLALQNQINPHFLYNTLEAIRGDAICAGMDSIAETTEALSIFFRYSITGVDSLVTLEEEIDNVENYFKIQYYRFGEKLKIRMNFPEDEDVFRLEIPKLTIQPFVENAIYHGLERKIQGGTIEVKVESTSNKLLITISDDGVGMPEETVSKINGYLEKVAVGNVGENVRKRGGIAMKNVNSRIKLLFGEEYGVQVYSTEHIGTDIKIILPKLRKGEYEKRADEN